MVVVKSQSVVINAKSFFKKLFMIVYGYKRQYTNATKHTAGNKPKKINISYSTMTRP